MQNVAVFEWAQLGEYWELTKPRLSLLSVITAMVGYLVANPERNVTVLLSLLLGTSLAAGAAGALNQWMERELDQRMARTRNRPIPSSAVSAPAALMFGCALALLGVAVLWLNVNELAAVLTIVTLVAYLAIYTPLKQKTHWCTLVGAFPGAIPPLIGWSAASAKIEPLGWVLFGIIFFWQIPHFMAIAWNFRKDYSAAGFVMSTHIDPTGNKAALQSILHCLLLLVVSVIPFFIAGATTLFYEILALVAGGFYFKAALHFRQADFKDAPARKLFLASIIYLPLILAVLLVDRWWFI